MTKYFLAVDVGASSGRHILGSVQDGKIELEEIYRFSNGMEKKNGHLCWNDEFLFSSIVEGLKKCKEIGKIPTSMGIDTWGVDFVLIDKEGKVINDAVGYRDHRTDHIKESVDTYISSKDLYARTGIQDQPYNTINQLMAIKEQEPEALEQAEAMLMTPDYYNYLLTGNKKQEYTIASTGQLLDITTNEWDYALIEKLGFPKKIFQEIHLPGTKTGNLKPEIVDAVGFDCNVIMVAAHDTASAVMSVPSLNESTLYISSGTWSLMGIENNAATCSEESRIAGFSNEGGYNHKYRYLKNIMGLWMIQSVKKEIGEGKSFGEICADAAKIELPTILDCNHSSFMAPESMVEAIQEYCKNTNQQVPQDLPEMASVIYKSLAMYYAKTKEQIEELTGIQFNQIYIVGGGSNATYLNELTAKYAECEVVAGPNEATAIGNLLCQMIEHGIYNDLDEARKGIIASFELKYYSN
ncbi:MAG: rhamnulokinase [Eubacteriales bacterium]